MPNGRSRAGKRNQIDLLQVSNVYFILDCGNDVRVLRMDAKVLEQPDEVSWQNEKSQL